MGDQLFGQQTAVMTSTLQGVSQARIIAETHAQSAKQLQEPLISAENEYNRICQMLSQPLVPSAVPSPTTAALPGTARTTPRTPPMTPVQNVRPAQSVVSTGQVSPAVRMR